MPFGYNFQNFALQALNLDHLVLNLQQIPFEIRFWSIVCI